jgi:putative endonuclease
MARDGKISSFQAGRRGEARAAAFLRWKGYRILERNYRVAQGEIDLIVRRGGVLAFVEVKARWGRAQGHPLEALPPRKVRRLSAAAAFYLAQNPGLPPVCRFDVVTLGPEKNWLGRPQVRHFEDAFSAEGFFNV